MEQPGEKGRGGKLGVNGFGRIGKLTVWHQVGRKHFSEIVVNIGREAGVSMADLAHYAERDSSYGRLGQYLYGYRSPTVIGDIDEANSSITMDGIKVRFLKTERNPADIGWREHGVKLVVETTGRFLDPTLPPDQPGGAVRGHLEAGADIVVVSAPFKIKDKGQSMPEDAITTVMGINANDFDPRRHRLVSNASCTTTCLAHMVKPLLNYFGPKRILSASMATVHAATGSQAVLDRLPKAGAKDLRKNRSIMNNIILTTTGAANALRLVIPEMEEIGFIAESVRVPTATGSLIILVLDVQEEMGGDPVRRDTINTIFRQAAEMDPNGYLHFSEKQNVSGDIVGYPRAATIIEGHETHTRTAEVTFNLNSISGLPESVLEAVKRHVYRIPITQVVTYGWYDNEMGSYVNMLGDRTVTVSEHMM
jgi:glyceraldehyde 3-phosphate dehydrogenase